MLSLILPRQRPRIEVGAIEEDSWKNLARFRAARSITTRAEKTMMIRSIAKHLAEHA